MAGFNMDDYVDVAERIREFYEKYPDGRLVTGTLPTVVEIGGRSFVWYHARAYRTPDDPLPGDGWAAEPVPGPTQFTKDSELMNAETAAWGRAIVALGFATKKIASANEVRNRIDAPPQAQEQTFKAPTGKPASEPTKNKLRAIAGKLEREKLIRRDQLDSVAGGNFDDAVKTMTQLEASGLIERLEKYERNLEREKSEAAA